MTRGVSGLLLACSACTAILATKTTGVGLAVGYDFTGISYAANIDAFPHDGAGFAGAWHGPRAGLSFDVLPERPPGPAFRARRDASSLALEVFGAALWSDDRPRATPALWLTIGGDAGR